MVFNQSESEFIVPLFVMPLYQTLSNFQNEVKLTKAKDDQSKPLIADDKTISDTPTLHIFDSRISTVDAQNTQPLERTPLII